MELAKFFLKLETNEWTEFFPDNEEFWLEAYVAFNSGAGEEAFAAQLKDHEERMSAQFEMQTCQAKMNEVQEQLDNALKYFDQLLSIGKSLEEKHQLTQSDIDQVKSYNSKTKEYLQYIQECFNEALTVIKERNGNITSLTSDINTQSTRSLIKKRE